MTAKNREYLKISLSKRLLQLLVLSGFYTLQNWCGERDTLPGRQPKRQFPEQDSHQGSHPPKIAQVGASALCLLAQTSTRSRAERM